MEDFFEDLLELDDIIVGVPEEKKLDKTSINMNPNGIDWTKEDIIFMDNYDFFLPNGKRVRIPEGFEKETLPTEEMLKSGLDSYKLSSHYTLVSFNICTPMINQAVDCGEYLSFKQWRAYGLSRDSYYQYCVTHNSIFKPAIIEVLCTWDLGNAIKRGRDPGVAQLDYEIRFYKDRTFVVLVRFDYSDGVSRYFAINPEVLKHSIRGTIILENFPDNSETEYKQTLYEEPVFIEITDERQLQFYHCKASLKQKNLLDLISAEYYGYDIHNRVITSHNGNSGKLHNYNEVNNFFGIFNDENKYIKQEFDEKVHSLCDRRWNTRNKSEGLVNGYLIANYCSMSGTSIATKERRKEFVSDLWPTLHFGEQDQTVWERRGDDIIVTYRNSEGGSWRRGASYCVFIYNTITKTRKVILSERADGSKASTIVPALENGILMNFNSVIQYDDTHERIKLPKRPVIIDGISLVDLFHNTNVEWILNNTTAFNPDFTMCLRDGHSTGTRHILKLKDQVCEECLSIVPIAILATTGTPVLEQLLKNKLFNLYFAVLDNMVNAYCITDSSSSKDGPRTCPTWCCALKYDGSETSLKKMFKMTPDQLRIIDSKITIKEEDEYCHDNYKVGEYHVPAIDGVLKVLGLASYNMIDPKTFTAALDIGKKELEYGRWAYQTGISNAWNQFAQYSEEIMEAVTGGMNLKQKMEFVNKYIESANIYVDYIRVRKSLKELQDSGATHGEIIFNPHWYPEKPTEAIKFVRYVEGAPYKNRQYSWITNHMTKDNFVEDYIPDRYGEGDHVEFIYEGERLIGATIKMNIKRHIQYLHDEATSWVNLYKDEAERIGFQEALKRVKPFEWEDEELGLSIIAPKNAAEVQQEGADNSFCVGSFVEPIRLGTTNVMFIRRTDMINDSYYCVELVKESGKYVVRQCHTYRNHNLSYEDQDKAGERSGHAVFNKHFDINKFLIKWATNFKDKIDAKSVKMAYGALCAHR